MRPPRLAPHKTYTSRNPVIKWLIVLMDGLLGKMNRARSNRPWQGDHAPDRILVCNQSHLGDAILAAAALKALASAFPHARIGVLVHPASAMVFSGMPEVGRIHLFEHALLNRRDESALTKLWRHGRTRRQAIHEIRLAKYDIAIDLYHFFPNSIPLLKASKVGWSAGWSSGGFGPWLDLALDDMGNSMHILDRHARLLDGIQSGLGLELSAGAHRPFLTVSRTSMQEWKAIADRHGVPREFIALHVGAHAAIRRWPIDKWTVLAQRLLERGHVAVILGLGQADDVHASAIAESCPGVINLSSQLAWDQLLAAISQCSVVVSHDSAAGHLAAALDRPRLCLAAGINDKKVWLHESDRSVVLMKPVACAPCFRSRGCQSMECIRGIEPEDALQACLGLVAISEEPPAS